ncbi:hypothetical protein KC968_04670 [Candidatus Saccharibacteria bacterium]|nr:hypothetical protein [Candidatus Saccharibacteria bacterium]
MTSDAALDKKPSLTSILESFENEWSSNISNVSLAAEYPISDDEAKEVQRVFRIYCGIYENRSEDRRKFLVRYPAVHVLLTTYIATEKYKNGGLWPQLASALEIANTQSLHNDWGESFAVNLKKLGLPVFDIKEDDIGWALLGNIMIHCGIPTVCLDDYYELISKQRNKNPGITASEFVAYGHQKANIGQLYIDKPIVRLLKFGGNFTVDLTDRLFELMDVVAAGSDGSDIPLPKRFSVKAQEMYSSGKIVASHAHNKSVRSISRPTLVLDTTSNIPSIRLPSIDTTETELTWVVEIDENPQEITTDALWPGSTVIESKSVPVPRPVRLVTVSLKYQDHSTTNLPVVDEHDPFITFDEDGAQLPTNQLGPNPTWILVPGAPTELIFDGEPIFITETALPVGWAKWSLSLVDLTNVHSIKYGASGKMHTVHDLKSARIVTNEQIEHTKSLTGSAVFSSLPVIEIPEEFKAANWEISLINDTGKVINRITHDDGYSQVDLWASVSRPVLGEYTIRVRGPWGRGATKTVFIAEGLSVDLQPKWRNLSADGLAEAAISVNANSDMVVEAEMIELPKDKKEAKIELSTSHGQRSILLVRPPYTSLSYQSAHTAVYESIKRQILNTEDVLEDAGSLIVHIDSRDNLVMKLLHNDSQVQTIEPSVSAKDTYKFNLSKITDTLRQYKQLSLIIENDGKDLLAAVIQPKKLFSDVSIEDNKLVFDECIEIRDLVAIVYLLRAPWIQPKVIEIENGIAILPDELTNAGPLRVTAKIQDPWVSEPIPAWPDPNTSYTCKSNGHYSSEDAEETSLSCFLSYYGQKELPEKIEDFTRIWAVLAHLESLDLVDFEENVADILRTKIINQARDALLAIDKSTLPTTLIPSALINSGLVSTNLNEGHDDHPPLWTVRGTLPAALLSAADHSWSEEEIDAAVEILGDNTEAILNLNDPNPMVGRFDEGTDRFVSSIEQRDLFISLMGLIPKGLLDEDTRTIAAMDLLERKDDVRIRRLVSQSVDMVQSIHKILSDNVSPEIKNAFISRMHPISNTGWRSIPTISIGMAILSRYASRGHQFAIDTMKAYEANWVSLAIVAPKFVTIDIVLAELLVAGALKKEKINE